MSPFSSTTRLGIAVAAALAVCIVVGYEALPSRLDVAASHTAVIATPPPDHADASLLDTVAPSTAALLGAASRPRPAAATRGKDMQGTIIPATCAKLGTVPPRVAFKQFYSHSLGEITMAQMREAGRDIANLAYSAAAQRAGLDLFIQDGTLMSAMRWGQAVNDNDVEFGFRFARLSPSNVTGHYFELLQLLVDAGIMDRPTPRGLKRMWQLTGVPKHGRCQMRPQLMQCRHRNGVMIDIFGPWVVFTSATKMTAESVLPPQRCRMFDYEMPCPKDPIAALKSFTLEHGSAGERKSTWFEFGHCPLLPVREAERSKAHLQDILRMSRDVMACGYPSLYQDRHDPLCADIFHRAGVEVPP